MSVLQATGLVLAGIGGGLTGSVAGLASLVTYPALLAMGLSPVGANVTNTAALVFSGVGSTIGSRPELVGQSARLRRSATLAVAGGVVGAVLALLTPSGIFARIVPWLILAAAIAIVRDRPEPALSPTGGRPHAAPAAAHPTGPSAGSSAGGAGAAGADPRSLPWVVGAIGVYGGYFGAAAGVLLLAVLLAVTAESLARANAVKNVLLGLSNLAGATVFALFGPLRWSMAVPLAAGCLIGARLGPAVVRRVPSRPLRLTIGALGVGLAVVLGVRAY